MRAAVLGGVLLLVAAPAWADAPAMVFPLSAVRLPPALAEAPDQLTRALAGSIDAEVASVPLEDAAGLLECDPEATACLEAVAKSMGAGRIVFGTITATSDTAIKVTLTRFDPGPTRQQRTFEIDEATVPELAEALVQASAPLFGRAPVRQVADPSSPLAPMPDPASSADGPRGSISTGTWALLGGGAAVTGAGLAFWISARGLREEVAAAPRATRADLDALVALEDQGTLRTRLGGVLTSVGGLALAYGIYRGVTERRQPSRERAAVVVTPVPIEGGAAIVFTLGMP